MSKLRKFTNGEISQVLSMATDLYVSDLQAGEWNADDCLKMARDFVAKGALMIDIMNDEGYMIDDKGCSNARMWHNDDGTSSYTEEI